MDKQAVFERIRRSSLGPRVIPHGVEVLVTTCGRYTADVENDIQRARLEFDDAIYRLLPGVAIPSPVVGIIAFPTVLDPGVGSLPDFASYDAEGFVRVGIAIRHATWKAASDDEKLDLHVANVKASIAKVRRTTLSVDDRTKLFDVIDRARNVARAMLWH